MRFHRSNISVVDNGGPGNRRCYDVYCDLVKISGVKEFTLVENTFLAQRGFAELHMTIIVPQICNMKPRVRRRAGSRKI